MSMYDPLANLSGARIDCVLIGGLAVTLHGYRVAELRTRRLFENTSGEETGAW